MKYIKKYNEDIDLVWEFDKEESEPSKKIPYKKEGIIYGKSIPQKQKPMKFDFEDRVICLYEHDDNYDIINETGEVVDFNNDEYLIFFDDNINGHDHNGIPDKHAWWVHKDKLKKVKE